MRLGVAAIGRLKDSPERELVERYCKRADQTGKRIGFRDVEVLEIKESRAQEVSKRMLEESIALANVIPAKAITVILDQRGESLDSGALAARLGRWRDDGVAPTASVGMPLAVGVTLQYDGDINQIQFIEQTSGAKLNITYYS